MKPDDELMNELDAVIRKKKEELEVLRNLLSSMQPKPGDSGEHETGNAEEENPKTNT